MGCKRNGLVIFFVVLILSIGISSISSPISSEAYELENKITEEIKKFCPSVENSGYLIDTLMTILESCLDSVSQDYPTTVRIGVTINAPENCRQSPIIATVSTDKQSVDLPSSTTKWSSVLDINQHRILFKSNSCPFVAEGHTDHCFLRPGLGAWAY